VVGSEFGVESADAPGQTDGPSSADDQERILVSGAPGRDGGDGRGGQGAAGVDVEVDGAQQGGAATGRARPASSLMFSPLAWAIAMTSRASLLP